MPFAISGQSRRTAQRRGAALFEMAFMLPILILMFVGMIEFGNFLIMRERINKVTNQLSGVLYNVHIGELQDINAIEAIVNQAAIIGRPLPDPTVTVRFCDWRAGRLYRINHQHRTGSKASACGDDGPQCGVDATQQGYGTFVQVYACSKFNPIFVGPIFKVFNQSLIVKSLTYFPLTESNIVESIERLPGGGRVPEGANCTDDPSLCGTPDATDPCKNIPNTEEVNGQCLTRCDVGYRRDAGGQCTCPATKVSDGNGGCACPGNQEWYNDKCVIACNYNCQLRDPATSACTPIPGKTC